MESIPTSGLPVSLIELNLDGNRISNVPAQTGFPRFLEILWLGGNPIEQFPLQIPKTDGVLYRSSNLLNIYKDTPNFQ